MQSRIIQWVPSFFLVGIILLLCPYTFLNIPLLPGIALPWIYHWTIYRPQRLPPLSLVLIGFMYDVVIENPYGLTSILFLMSHSSLVYFRQYLSPLSFFYIWAYFGLYAGGYAVLNWILACFFTLHWASPLSVLSSVGLAFILYPFLSRFMILIQKRCHV